MSSKIRDVSPEYRAAELVAETSYNPGGDVVDLPAIRRAAFIHGYAQCLIDHKILGKGKKLRRSSGG